MHHPVADQPVRFVPDVDLQRAGRAQELLEAARVDGASEFRTFWQISLPLLAPGIVTTALFTIVATWNNYFLPLIMLMGFELVSAHDRFEPVEGPGEHRGRPGDPEPGDHGLP